MKGEPVHTTQTICKLHERNAREEVLNSSQFIKLQKVKVKTKDFHSQIGIFESCR